MKNKTRIFFVLTLLAIILAVSTVNATDTANDIVDTTQAASSDVISQDTDIVSDNNIADTKNEIKKDKTLKTATKTVEVNNMNELTATINDAVNDSENNEYVINMNEGTYQITNNVIINSGSTKPNITINGNNQKLSASISFWNLQIKNGCNMTFNDLTIDCGITFDQAVNLVFNNITLTNKIQTNTVNTNLTVINATIPENYMVMNPIIIPNNSTLTMIDCAMTGGLNYLTASNNQNITLINTQITRLTGGSNNNIYLVNSTTTDSQPLSTSGSNITIDNSTLTGPHGGQLRSGDNSIVVIKNNSKINRLFTGKNTNTTITDTTFTNSGIIDNSGNMILESGVVTKGINSIANKGTLTICEGATISAGTLISNSGVLNIDDNAVLEEGRRLSGAGTFNVSNLSAYFKYFDGIWASDGTVDLGEYDSTLRNDGTLTIENTTLTNSITNNNKLTLKNSTTTNKITNRGTITFENTTINSNITNTGTVIISDDSIIGENFYIDSNGEIIINDTHRIAEFLITYNDDYTLINKTFDVEKKNLQNLTLIDCNVTEKLTNKGKLNLTNCIINSTIENTGVIYIDENTVFGENAEITGIGEIVTDDITRILPYLSTINGNYTISDTEFGKNYTFKGNITLNNCTLIGNNKNLGFLTLNNSVLGTDETETMENYGVILVANDTQVNAVITGIGDVFEESLPDNYIYTPNLHIVNNDTVKYFFNSTDNGGLSELVESGDTLDFQGTIDQSIVLRFNKPVNVTSTTHDALIILNSGANGGVLGVPDHSFIVDNGGSYSNFTDLSLRQTQFWVTNSHEVYFNNMSMVVEGVPIGSNVGQTTIRDNSSYVTINNSFIYTKDNGGHSSFVITYSSHCTIENSIIQGEGYVGNILYLNYYNPIISTPEGNCFNTIRNNTIIGPDSPLIICYAIAVAGHDNQFIDNKVYYSGESMTGAYGVIHEGGRNLVSGNQFYNGGSVYLFNATFINNTLYDNSPLSVTADAYNNTANSMTVSSNNEIIDGNNVNTMTIYSNSTKITNNNITLLKIVDTSTNLTIENNIIGQIDINATDSTIKNNNITNDAEYTITGCGTNNTITENYLLSAENYGDTSVALDKDTNIIENNKPIFELLIDPINITANSNAVLTASMYFDNEVATNINTGKVCFKVNGKILRDETTKKVIYVDVKDGIATLECTNTTNWNNQTTIQATYMGSGKVPQVTSEVINPTINTAEDETPEFTVSDATASSGSEVTITVTTKNLDAGKVVLKVNGKTVKADDGKLYDKTTGETTTFTYIVSKTLKAGEYAIKAVYTSGTTKLEAYSKLTVE